MFFQQMFQMMQSGVDYNLTLSRTADRLTVMVMPKANGVKDAAQNKLVPLVLTATPDEIDRGFFAVIQQPIMRAAGLLTNMAEHEKQTAKAASDSKSSKKESKEKKSEPAQNDLFKAPETPAVPPTSTPEVAPPTVPQPVPETPTTTPPAPQPIPQQPQPPLPPAAAIPVQPAAPPMQQPMMGFFQPQPPHQAPTQQPPQPYQQPYAPQAVPLYNPDDYANIPDVQYTHVGQIMQPQI